MAYDRDLFRGAAPFYDRSRAPYSADALSFLAEKFQLDRNATLIDLGCGPGTLARRYAHEVKEVVAMDPDAEMLAEGRRLAELEGVRNIHWMHAGSEELSMLGGGFRAVVMGQSFHWMDRDQVLHELHRLLEDDGKIGLINPGRRRPQESWETIAAAVVERYLGRPQPHPQRNRELDHEPALRRSAFEITVDIEFTTVIDRDFPSILGAIYSNSSSTPERLRERRAEFESDLEAALLRACPSGAFHETIETGVIVAEKT